jgi:hypothetical protein
LKDCFGNHVDTPGSLSAGKAGDVVGSVIQIRQLAGMKPSWFVSPFSFAPPAFAGFAYYRYYIDTGGIRPNARSVVN